MKKVKNNRIMLFILIFIFLLMCAMLILKPIKVSQSNEVDYGMITEVTPGLSISLSANGKLSDEQLNEFVEEYGTDSNIIIYEVE